MRQPHDQKQVFYILRLHLFSGAEEVDESSEKILHAGLACLRVVEELHDLQFTEGFDHGILVLCLDLEVLDGHALLGVRPPGSHHHTVGPGANHLFNIIIVFKSRFPYWIEPQAPQAAVIDWDWLVLLGSDV